MTDDDRREWYQQQRDSACEIEERVAHSFDKAMLTLSAGALGLSVTFVQHIAPNPVHLCRLACAWAGFGLSLVSTLLSLLLSQHALRQYRRSLDDRIARKSSPERRRSAHVTNCLNWASAILFIVGVWFLAWFSFANLQAR